MICFRQYYFKETYVWIVWQHATFPSVAEGLTFNIHIILSRVLNDQRLAINYFLNREINVNLTHINTNVAAVDKKQLKMDK
jgi:2-hydroxy-3-keto-5-methylthiopentenyl-1-phosphate phosphatase